MSLQSDHSARTDLSRLSGMLNAAENAPPGSAVEVVARQLLASIGATEVGFLIADLSGDCLVPVTRVSVSEAEAVHRRADVVPIESSHAGLALRRQQTQIIPDGDGYSLFAPVTCRGDAMGVLDLKLAVRPSSAVVDDVNASAHALAYIVVANRRHTDLFEWGQRSRPMSLAAEIQRRLIPDSSTCEAGRFTLAGWLEPSSEAAGDTFDYSFDETSLSLSMTDAMGHSTDSAILATVALAALRSARQMGSDIGGRASSANDSLMKNSTEDQFVTGMLVDVPLDGSTATIVNAGHPPPFLVRDGVVKIVSVAVNYPLGMFAGAQYAVQRLDLQIGDRLILVTDGLLERNAADFDIEGSISRLASLHPRQMVRQLCRNVTAAAGGELQDDATVLCLDWHGEVGVARQSTSGSDDHIAGTHK